MIMTHAWLILMNASHERASRWAPCRRYRRDRRHRHRLSGLRPSIHDSFVPLLRVIRNWQKVKWACGHSFGFALCLLIPPSSSSSSSSLNNHVTRKLSRIPRSSTPSHALSLSQSLSKKCRIRRPSGNETYGPKEMNILSIHRNF